MIVRNDKDEFSHIACDLCGVSAPPSEEIKRAFGLNQLGWYCSGGKHICPAHPHPNGGEARRLP